MRMYALLFAVSLTFAYTFAAQAAIAKDMARVRTEAPAPEAGRLFYGGTLAPITVTASRPHAGLVRKAVCRA